MPIALLLILYVLVVGQTWAYYSATLMIYTHDLQGGRWNSAPFSL